MNKTATCTDDHPFLVFDGKATQTKLAKNLTVTDKLPCYLGFPEKSSKIKIIDVINRLDKNKLY